MVKLLVGVFSLAVAAPLRPGSEMYLDPNADHKFGRLAKWMKDTCGPNLTGLENVFIGDFAYGGGWEPGMGVVNDTGVDDYFLCLPQDCWFGPANMPQRYQALAEAFPDECDSIQYRLALWHADELRKGDLSKWKAWHDYIPTEEKYRKFHPAYARKMAEDAREECLLTKSEAECPLGWVPDEQIDYWGSWWGYAFDCYNKYRDSFDTFTVPADEVGAELLAEPITEEQYSLAYLQIMTRDFDAAGALPLGDMPNTGDEYTAGHYYGDTEQTSFCFKPYRDLKAGEEVLVDYAATSKTPIMFFAQYGFHLSPSMHKTARTGSCKGLGPDSAVHKKEHPIAANYAEFSKVFCPAEGGEL